MAFKVKHFNAVNSAVFKADLNHLCKPNITLFYCSCTFTIKWYSN